MRRREAELFYRAYHELCNAHRFDELGAFVADDVVVNDSEHGLDTYVAGLTNVVRAFPDYRWNLRVLLINGNWLTARFLDTGTHRGEFLGVPATGRSVSLQEISIYRLEAGKIAEVWVTADNHSLLMQLS